MGDNRTGDKVLQHGQCSVWLPPQMVIPAIFPHVLSKKEKLFFISQVCVSKVLVYRTGLMTPEPIAGVLILQNRIIHLSDLLEKSLITAS